MAQLVASMSGIVLGGVVMVVGSNLGSVDSLYPSNIYSFFGTSVCANQLGVEFMIGDTSCINIENISSFHELIFFYFFLLELPNMIRL